MKALMILMTSFIIGTGAPGIIKEAHADVGFEWNAIYAPESNPEDIRVRIYKSPVQGEYNDPHIIQVDGAQTTATAPIADGNYFFKLTAFTAYNPTETVIDEIYFIVNTAPIPEQPEPSGFKVWLIKND